MEKLISVCGLVCSECPAYIATKNNDDNLRKETALEWSKRYNADIKPENINCGGCLSKDILFSHCSIWVRCRIGLLQKTAYLVLYFVEFLSRPTEGMLKKLPLHLKHKSTIFCLKPYSATHPCM